MPSEGDTILQNHEKLPSNFERVVEYADRSIHIETRIDPASDNIKAHATMTSEKFDYLCNILEDEFNESEILELIADCELYLKEAKSMLDAEHEICMLRKIFRELLSLAALITSGSCCVPDIRERERRLCRFIAGTDCLRKVLQSVSTKSSK